MNHKPYLTLLQFYIIVQGALKLYKWPLPSEWDNIGVKIDSNMGFFQGLPFSEPKAVMVRIYIIKAMDLHPTDVNGKVGFFINRKHYGKVPLKNIRV